MLFDLAESVGLDKKEIEDYLSTGEPSTVVQQSLKEVRNYGINGVPAFIIEDRLIYGAQPYKVFKQVINEVLDQNSK